MNNNRKRLATEVTKENATTNEESPRSKRQKKEDTDFKFSLLDLPKELWFQISEFMNDGKTLLNLTECSKSFYALLSDETTHLSHNPLFIYKYEQLQNEPQNLNMIRKLVVAESPKIQRHITALDQLLRCLVGPERLPNNTEFLNLLQSEPDTTEEAKKAAELVSFISKCGNLKILSAASRMIGPNTLQLLSALSSCKKLETLDMQHNFVSVNITGQMTPIILPKLTRLILDENVFESNFLQLLSHQYFPSLEELSMRSCDISAALMKVLSQSLKDCSSLKMLILDKNNFEEEGASYLADALHNLPNLEEFSLEENSLVDKSTALIATALQYCPKMNRLRFKGNDVKITAAEALCKTFKSWNNLSEFKCDNCLNADGFLKLYCALLECKSLTSISLCACQVNPTAFKNFCRRISELKQLKNLELFNLDIQDAPAAECFSKLIDQLSEMKELRLLDLSFNKIDECVTSLCKVLPLCTKLEYFTVIHGCFKVEDMVAICTALNTLQNIKSIGFGEHIPFAKVYQELVNADAGNLPLQYMCFTHLEIVRADEDDDEEPDFEEDEEVEYEDLF